MRFIKLETAIDQSGKEIIIDFDERINIIRIKDLEKFKIIKEIFSRNIFNPPGSKGGSDKKLLYNLHLSYLNNIYRLDNTGNITEEISPEAVDKRKKDEAYPSLYQYKQSLHSDFYHQLSFIDFSIADGHNSIEVTPDTPGPALIAIEMLKNNIPLPDTEKLLLEKEEELSSLLKQKQLIEIKKMRKEKLQKEISSVSRGLTSLNKQLKVTQDYKDTLNSISEKIKLKEILASKVNSYKKEVLGLREIKTRLNELEKELKSEFPQFKNYSENIADLEVIEKNFTALKEINSTIDKLKNSEKNVRGKTFKIIGGVAVFSITAILFLLIQKDIFPIPFIIASSLLISLITIILSSLKIKEYNTESLTEEQLIQQQILSESLGNSRFSFENYNTEELYEFLLQYFDDFIKFSEIQSEIADLKGKIASQPDLRDTEKKLNSRISEIEAIEKDISQKLLSLDQAILPIPNIENIPRSLLEIDELIVSTEEEITREDSIRKKIEQNISDYNKKDNSHTSFETQAAETEVAIKNIEEEKNAIKYMHEITEDSSRKWIDMKLETLCDITWQTIEKIASKDENPTLKDEHKVALHHLLKKGESRSPLNEIPSSLIKTAMIYAIEKTTESGSFAPPLIIALQNEPAENNTCEKIVKNVLELFNEKQVIIITSAPIPGISGKITDI